MKIFNTSNDEAKLFLEACIFTIIARFITFFPLRFYIFWIKKNPSKYNSHDTDREISLVIRTMSRIKKYLPFDSTCLVQAIVAKKLLYRKGISSYISFGISKTDRQLKAHAWLEHDGRIITGGSNTSMYTVLYTI